MLASPKPTSTSASTPLSAPFSIRKIHGAWSRTSALLDHRNCFQALIDFVEGAELFCTTVVQMAFEYPFLMHEILAMAAIHLARLWPQKRSQYSTCIQQIPTRRWFYLSSSLESLISRQQTAIPALPSPRLSPCTRRQLRSCTGRPASSNLRITNPQCTVGETASWHENDPYDHVACHWRNLRKVRWRFCLMIRRIFIPVDLILSYLTKRSQSTVSLYHRRRLPFQTNRKGC
jgi:hypothetical protein